MALSRMAKRPLFASILQVQKIQKANLFRYRRIIGNREIVGYGYNGNPCYADRVDFPFPAIRWKESTPEIQALREKERGDWRRLQYFEKKILYRSSFRSTFAEMKAPTHEWMSIVGIALTWCSVGTWLFLILQSKVNRELPDSFTKASKQDQLKRQINLRYGHVDGLASHWDYETGKWKNNRPYIEF